MNHCVAHLSTSSHRQSTSVLADEKTLYGQNFKTFYSQTIILLLQQSHWHKLWKQRSQEEQSEETQKHFRVTVDKKENVWGFDMTGNALKLQ